MDTNTKTVLLFQPCRFQADMWRSILWEHNIILIWEENYPTEQDATNYFKKLELKPNLLIIDLKIDNAYEICRSFAQNYSSSKIILTTDLQDGYSSAIRRWAVNQGVDEMLINFQKENLFSNVITNINLVLKLLEFPPAEEKILVKTLDSLEQKTAPTPLRSKETNYSQPQNISFREPQTKGKTVFPVVRIGFVLVFIAIITIIVDNTNLFSPSPVDALQRKILIKSKTKAQKNSIAIKAFGQINTIPQGIFNYGGSTTWSAIHDIVNSKIAKQYPEFNLRYLPAIDTTPGSGTGIKMLLQGDLDFAHSSRSIEPEEHILAHQQGFTLREYHIAIDAIAIGVHPSLPVLSLTVEELKKIYLGEITNWKELNGPDLPITAFTRIPKHGGTARFFERNVLHDQTFNRDVKYVYSTTDGLRQLKNTPGGIYYDSATGIVPQCHVKPLSIANNDAKFVPPYNPPYIPPGLGRHNCPHQRNQLNLAAIENGTYPLTRYLSVIVKQDGGRAQEAGEAYTKLLLTKEIQALIEETGFVPIY
ncbi:MAG: substrate-binding domain-containing protein [Xenococcaceae cyanobacterium MO_167.B52]|nr:substrate-binding domain-containing protein [Xenococcaceae cyanobacterium MO_167.B52]